MISLIFVILSLNGLTHESPVNSMKDVSNLNYESTETYDLAIGGSIIDTKHRFVEWGEFDSDVVKQQLDAWVKAKLGYAPLKSQLISPSENSPWLLRYTMKLPKSAVEF